MTDEQMRVKIAEACGWTGVRKLGEKPWHQTVGKSPSACYSGEGFERIPNYPQDLNACHKMIAVANFDANQMLAYELHLKELAAPHYTTSAPLYVWCMMHATARQRCEAFLKTLNLWDDKL